MTTLKEQIRKVIIDIISKRQRLCCTIHPEHVCNKCNYTLCNLCCSALRGIDSANEGKNLVYDDHLLHTPNCKGQVRSKI